jgi:multiple sugar transport system permease protein
MATVLDNKPVEQIQANPGDLRRARRDRVIRRFNTYVLPRIVLIAVCFIFIMPFYFLVTIGLKGNAELIKYPPTYIPEKIFWSNYKNAIDVFPFWNDLKNSAIITGLTVLGAVISNPIIAYGFSRLNWPGRDKVFMLVLATVFMPWPVLLVALFDIYSKLGWVNTYAPLTVSFFFGNAFWIFLTRQFMLQIPLDLSDAARLDGANEFKIFYQIVLPQCVPAIGVIAIFAGMGAWNDFLGPLGLTSFISSSSYDVSYNLLLSAATLITLPVIVLFLLFQKSFIGGISVGSIK